MENQPSPQQPDYFRLSEPPASPERIPWYKNTHSGKRIAIFLGVALFLAFVVIFAINVVEWKWAGTPSPQDIAQEEIVKAQAQCSAEDSACRDRARADVARASGLVDACAGLESDVYTNCVELIARDAQDKALCDALSGADRDVCQDKVVLALAQDGSAFSLCAEVHDDVRRETCEGVVEAYARARGTCAEQGVDMSVCEAKSRMAEILLAGDASACAELASSERSTCVDLFHSTDSDGDGLTAFEESTYGTSDADADTDKDGYTDREEISTGHDPLN